MAVDLMEMNLAVVEKDDCCVVIVIGVGDDGCGGRCTHQRRIVISWIVESWKWWLAGCYIIVFHTSFCFVQHRGSECCCCFSLLRNNHFY